MVKYMVISGEICVTNNFYMDFLVLQIDFYNVVVYNDVSYHVKRWEIEEAHFHERN